MRVTRIFKEFAQSEQFGGVLLIGCTIISLLLSNSSYEPLYHQWIHFPIVNQTVEYWVNDGLMTIFFLLVGLELKRELLIGELSNIQNALLPMFSAIGGMVVPVLCYTYFNWGTTFQSGAAIPMATDIAFALGVLSLLGNTVPVSLKVFLTALAVIDDLGAIVVIALFYTNTLVWVNIAMTGLIYMILIGFNYFKIKSIIPYVVGGLLMWYLMLHSGIHATITGVLLAFVIPFDKGAVAAASNRLLRWLHKPVAYVILPLFALVNTAVTLEVNLTQLFTSTYAWGILVGLVLGKPIGIFAFTYGACKLNICKLPSSLNWKSIFGVSLLGGIGFTMSIFITLLSFEQETIISMAKLVILMASLLAAIVGFVLLKKIIKNK